MANTVASACCVVLAVVVVVYAQRHGQQEIRIQYERLGSDFTMKCGTMDWDAGVSWTLNGTDIDKPHLNGSSLMFRTVGLSHNGLYSCYDSSWQLRHQVTLKVGYAPKEPVVACRSNNYPNSFYCSWHLPSPTYIPNNFNISVTHGSKQLSCEKDLSPKNRCHIKYNHLFSSLKYRVTVVVTNALGSNSASITFEEFAIVKPDPPENVVVKPVVSNPKRLEVTWQNPASWPDPDSFPLKFFLRYRPLIIDQWQHVELSDGTSHTITDAFAGKEYIIQVAAKDSEIGTWSDWSVAAHATSWMEEPKHLTTEAQIIGMREELESAETTTTRATTTTTTTTVYTQPPTTKMSEKGSIVGNSAAATSCLCSLLIASVSILFI